jgi:DNA end-binding protein Ku
MPRAIWKGAISFGLVTVPVGLYSATERAAELHFRLLHAKDESPIDYKRVCEKEGVEVPWAEIARGYEVTKGEYVVVTDKELAQARVEATQTFAIRDFVPARSIDVRYYDEPYYLAPTAKPAARAYALLREAMADAERVGVGTIVLRQREHLAALVPTDRALILATLRFADEVRRPENLDLPAATRNGGRELALARQLIDSLASEWAPERYHDTYRDAVLEVIEQKAKGHPIKAAAERKPAKVVDLMEALQQSLKAPRRGGAKAGSRPAQMKTSARGRRTARRAGDRRRAA